MENIENREETENLEAEFEEARSAYTSKFESKKITKDFELVYINNADGNISPQIRKVGADK